MRIYFGELTILFQQVESVDCLDILDYKWIIQIQTFLIQFNIKIRGINFTI